LINKIGIKYSCLIAAITVPLHGSSFYVNATQGIEWYLLLGNVSRYSESGERFFTNSGQIIRGSTSGFLYVAETTAMLSYPRPDERGFYLGMI
jgi:hypothetical protein